MRGADTMIFEYDRARLEDTDRFSLESALALTSERSRPPHQIALLIGQSSVTRNVLQTTAGGRPRRHLIGGMETLITI